jgi:broad specificity phosphatase PhoE
MNRIYMIRHGQPKSTWGQSNDDDPGLNDAGNAQAIAARDQLLSISSEFRPTAVVTSPLARCRETAAPTARALGVEAQIDPTFGEIPTPAGVPREQRPEWLRAAFAGRWREIDGDLDYEAWRRNIVAGLKLRAGAAVFSHFVAINAAVSAVLGTESVAAIRPDHASITTFELRDGELVLCQRGREAQTRVL